MVVSALVNSGRDPGAAAGYRSVIDGRTVVVSFVTVTELRFGAIKAGGDPASSRERVLVQLLGVQPDDDLMLTCAELRAKCLDAGHALGQKVHEADRWIAATAMALGAEGDLR